MGLRTFLVDSFYLAGLSVTVPYLLLTGRRKRVEDHLRRRLGKVPERRGARPCVWIHGVSVGELLSARYLVERFSRRYPDWDVFLSTTTRAGLVAGNRYYRERAVASCPLDFGHLVRRAFERVRPDLLLIVEHDLWPNLLSEARTRGVPVAVVNGRLSEKSLRGYRWLEKLASVLLESISLFCVEDETSGARFRSLGVPEDRIHVTGNMKFDNRPEKAPGIRHRLGISDDNWVLVAASLHSGEAESIVHAFDQLRKNDDKLRLILAPRRPERAGEIDRLLRQRGYRSLRWTHIQDASRIDARRDIEGLETPDHVLVIDTIGDLQKIMAAGDAVFVGGSFVSFGGHNVIEPASHGKPVIIGPHYENFQCVVSRFLEREALHVVNDADELREVLIRLRHQGEKVREVTQQALQTIEEESGASDRTLDALEPLVRMIAPSPVARREDPPVLSGRPRAREPLENSPKLSL